MFAVDYGFAAGGNDRFDALANGCEVLLVLDAECDADMEVPGFCDEADGVAIGLEDALETQGSLDTDRPARLVMPKAVDVACS